MARTRSHTRTRTYTIFTAGEAAPDPREALGGSLVPNELGNIALTGFRVNQLNPRSEVNLDLTVEPPVLHLRDAITTAIFGYTDESKGEFVENDNELSRSEREITGTYTGPGSELKIL